MSKCVLGCKVSVLVASLSLASPFGGLGSFFIVWSGGLDRLPFPFVEDSGSSDLSMPAERCDWSESLRGAASVGMDEIRRGIIGG